MESELLPCPFCDFVPITDSADFDRGERFRVICQSLKCNMSVYTHWCNSKEEALKIWNTCTNKAEQVLAGVKEWLRHEMNLNDEYNQHKDINGNYIQVKILESVLDKINGLQGE